MHYLIVLLIEPIRLAPIRIKDGIKWPAVQCRRPVLSSVPVALRNAAGFGAGTSYRGESLGKSGDENVPAAFTLRDLVKTCCKSVNPKAESPKPARSPKAEKRTKAIPQGIFGLPPAYIGNPSSPGPAAPGAISTGGPGLVSSSFGERPIN
jgi:hypothetical protein